MVKYSTEGAWVTFPITIYQYDRTYYTTTSSSSAINPQRIGGVIYNARMAGYYPFGQTITDAKVKHYRNDSLYATWTDFSWKGDGLADPDDLPWGYECTSTKYLYDTYDNKLSPSVLWQGNGTLPMIWTLDGNPIYF